MSINIIMCCLNFFNNMIIYLFDNEVFVCEFGKIFF